MSARAWWFVAAGALFAAVLQGCSGPQGQAFLSNVGGVDGLMKNLQQATGAISEPQEIEMGHGMVETLLGARPMVDDPGLQRYVNAVGAWVASQSERPLLPWRFAVNDSEHVNAFAAPGGYVIVTRGMMNVVQNEAELAGVLAHEIGHVIRKHHLNAIRKGAFVNLLGAGAAAGTSGTRSAELVNALVGPTKELYSRGLDKDDEFEADRVGIVLATRAGYDPWGLPSALQTLAKIKADDPYMALLFKTHPNPSARLEKLGTAMGKQFDRYDNAALNADRFQRAVARLRTAAR
jgi:predicted Zn-dependent protease